MDLLLSLLTLKQKNSMDLKNLQIIVDNWIKEHGVRYFDELTNMAQLTEEVGEVARIISRKYGEQSLKENEELSNLGEELADVLFVLICIANQTGTDLESSFKEKLEKKTTRDKSRHKDNPKLKVNSLKISGFNINSNEKDFYFWVKK